MQSRKSRSGRSGDCQTNVWRSLIQCCPTLLLFYPGSQQMISEGQHFPWGIYSFSGRTACTLIRDTCMPSCTKSSESTVKQITSNLLHTYVYGPAPPDQLKIAYYGPVLLLYSILYPSTSLTFSVLLYRMCTCTCTCTSTHTQYPSILHPSTPLTFSVLLYPTSFTSSSILHP